jgi:hypothetical protein
MQRNAFVCAIVVLLFVLGVASELANAQPCSPARYRTWLRVADTGAGRDTLWFGHDSTATYGIDPTFCEVEYPPIPPAGVFDARFQNKPGMDGVEPPAGLGQGVHLDFRRIVSRGQIDTFKIYFQPTVPPGYPINIRWSISGLLAIADSARLIDMFGGVFMNVRMQTVDSAQVTMSAITNLLLIKYGVKPPVSVKPVESGIPDRFELAQNYPNPFNPSTQFRFAVEQRSHVEIVVYDLAGRKVATIASDELAPGYYAATWEGRNDNGYAVASGAYFVRMTATVDHAQVFSATHKVVLLK